MTKPKCQVGSRDRRLLQPEKAGLAMTMGVEGEEYEAEEIATGFALAMTRGIIRGGLRTARGGRTIPGHSERASTMEKPTGDELRHRTAIFWLSILRVSRAIARAKTTFPDAAS